MKLGLCTGEAAKDLVVACRGDFEAGVGCFEVGAQFMMVTVDNGDYDCTIISRIV